MVDLSKFTPPFQVIPMPLNANGDGPEMNPFLVARTTFEVWDAACSTVASFEHASDAELFASDCNDISQD
jgi:hypothetical protein